MDDFCNLISKGPNLNPPIAKPLLLILHYTGSCLFDMIKVTRKGFVHSYEYTRMHSSRMRTAHLLTISHSAQGGLPTPVTNPLDAHPPGGRDPPGGRHPMEADTPWRQTLPGGRPPGHVTCDACWEANPPVKRMTDRCKNITLSQTSFSGRKNPTFILKR